MEIPPHEHERETSRREQVFHGPGGEQVDAELADVQRDRAGRLVAVCKTQRAPLPRKASDLGDVEAIAAPVRDRGAADEGSPLVDRLREALERDPAVGLRAHVDDLRPPQLLCVRDLADRGELELGDHDPRAPLIERQRADERADRLRHRGRDRDLARLRVHEPRESRARRLGPLDPVLPLGAVHVPAGEVLVVRLANVRRERALRAGVRVRRVLEDREARANSLPDGSASGQGRPSVAPRAGSAPTPCPRARSDRSRGRTRGRRSRAIRSRSARRRGARPRRRGPAR